MLFSELFLACDWTSPSPCSWGLYTVTGSCSQVSGSSLMQADRRSLAEPGFARSPILSYWSSWCQGMWAASWIHTSQWHQHVLHTGTVVAFVVFVAHLGIIERRIILSFELRPQFSSMNMTKAEPGKEQIYTKVCWIFKSIRMLMNLSSSVHLQSTAPCLSDHDLSKLVSISPLFKTLQEIQQSLQSLTKAESNQPLHNGTEKASMQCLRKRN